MNDGLPSGMLVAVLLKRVNDAGGIGVVRARGNADSGAVLLILSEQGMSPRLVERRRVLGARTVLVPAGPVGMPDAAQIDEYWRRRRSHDPDLWVIELDIASAERFAAETICAD